jgi:hypothetical protein
MSTSGIQAVGPTVLYIRQDNAGHSQLGAAFLDHLARDN